MTNTIDLDAPVAQVLTDQPELLEILVDLGFKPLANPAMRASLGRVTSLRRGSSLIGLPLEALTRTLLSHGYDLKGDD